MVLSGSVKPAVVQQASKSVRSRFWITGRHSEFDKAPREPNVQRTLCGAS